MYVHSHNYPNFHHSSSITITLSFIINIKIIIIIIISSSIILLLSHELVLLVVL